MAFPMKIPEGYILGRNLANRTLGINRFLSSGPLEDSLHGLYPVPHDLDAIDLP